jgi:hypothetical protein
VCEVVGRRSVAKFDALNDRFETPGREVLWQEKTLGDEGWTRGL